MVKETRYPMFFPRESSVKRFRMLNTSKDGEIGEPSIHDLPEFSVVR